MLSSHFNIITDIDRENLCIKGLLENRKWKSRKVIYCTVFFCFWKLLYSILVLHSATITWSSEGEEIISAECNGLRKGSVWSSRSFTFDICKLVSVVHQFVYYISLLHPWYKQMNDRLFWTIPILWFVLDVQVIYAILLCFDQIWYTT